MEGSGSGSGDPVAAAALRAFAALPRKGKPSTKAYDWTVLAAFVLTGTAQSEPEPVVVALATGTKCLGHSLLGPDGHTVLDQHAEVIARRCFQRFLFKELEECARSSSGGSTWLIRRPDGTPFALRPGVKVALYISQAPSPKRSKEDETGPPSGASPRYADQRTGAKPVPSGPLVCSRPPMPFGAHAERALVCDMEFWVCNGERTKARATPSTPWACFAPNPAEARRLIPCHARTRSRAGPAGSASRALASLGHLQAHRPARCRLWTGCQGALLGLLVEPIFLSDVVVSHLFNREALARALLERCARGPHAANVRLLALALSIAGPPKTIFTASVQVSLQGTNRVFAWSRFERERAWTQSAGLESAAAQPNWVGSGDSIACVIHPSGTDHNVITKGRRQGFAPKKHDADASAAAGRSFLAKSAMLEAFSHTLPVLLRRWPELSHQLPGPLAELVQHSLRPNSPALWPWTYKETKLLNADHYRRLDEFKTQLPGWLGNAGVSDGFRLTP